MSKLQFGRMNGQTFTYQEVDTDRYTICNEQDIYLGDVFYEAVEGRWVMIYYYDYLEITKTYNTFRSAVRAMLDTYHKTNEELGGY